MLDATGTALAADPAFAAELERLAAGGAVEFDRIMKWLTAPPVAERAAANRLIGKALRKSGRLAEAIVFMERAWRIEGPPPGAELELPEVLIRARRIRDALDRLREVGFFAARRGDANLVGQALLMFQQHAIWIDQAQNDHVLTRLATETFAAVAGPAPSPTPLDGRKLRLGYVFYCEQDPKSTLPPIYPNYARHHDPERVQASFYSFSSREAVLHHNPRFAAIEQQLEAQGQPITYGPSSGTAFERAHFIAQRMREDGLDVCFLNYGLFYNFILASLRPCPLVATIDFGDPQQYSALPIDVNFTRFEHFKMESLCRVEELGLYFPRAVPDRSQAYSRAELDFPQDEPVVICCGASYKFSNPGFWKTVIAAQSIEPKGFYVFIGPTEADVPTEIQGKLDMKRNRFLGFRTDFSRILPAGDILLDTFPTGGGHTLLEAMAHSIPCVMLKHDFRRLFNKGINYFPYATLPYIRDLTIPPERLDQVAMTLVSLIRSPEERARYGEAGQRMYSEAMDGPTFIRRLEDMVIRELKALAQ